MPNPFTLAATLRAALLRRDKAASKQLAEAYKVAYANIKQRSDSLLLKIAEAREANQTITVSWLYQRDRLASVLVQVEAEINKFSRIAEGVITSAQSDVIEQALENAPKLISSVLGEIPPTIQVLFDQVPRRAVESLVGVLSDGSPLSTLLAELGPQARLAVQQALLSGITSGQGVRQVAREIRRAAGMNLTRALTISRTEILRAHRSATLLSYRENRDVVRGWVWLSSGLRSCGSCLSLHGSEHSLEESLDSHPNCACTMLPLTRSWSELGFSDIPDTEYRMESGEDIFARFTPEQQQSILGKAGQAAYSRGDVRLSDFVGVHSDPRWGRMHYQKPFREITPGRAALASSG